MLYCSVLFYFRAMLFYVLFGGGFKKLRGGLGFATLPSENTPSRGRRTPFAGFPGFVRDARLWI